MKLADEWKQAWKWLSVQLGFVMAVAPELYQQFGALQPYFGDAAFHRGMSILGILVMLNTVKRKSQ